MREPALQGSDQRFHRARAANLPQGSRRRQAYAPLPVLERQFKRLNGVGIANLANGFDGCLAHFCILIHE